MIDNYQRIANQQYHEHMINKHDHFRKKYKSLSIIDVTKNLIKHQNHNVTNNQFFQKLIIHWPEIVSDKMIARHSIPGKITNDNNKLILQIYSYNGAITVQLQSSIKQIKQNIKLHIGYFPVNDIRIIQKSGLNI